MRVASPTQRHRPGSSGQPVTACFGELTRGRRTWSGGQGPKRSSPSSGRDVAGDSKRSRSHPRPPRRSDPPRSSQAQPDGPARTNQADGVEPRACRRAAHRRLHQPAERSAVKHDRPARPKRSKAPRTLQTIAPRRPPRGEFPAADRTHHAPVDPRAWTRRRAAVHRDGTTPAEPSQPEGYDRNDAAREAPKSDERRIRRRPKDAPTGPASDRATATRLVHEVRRHRPSRSDE